MDSINIKSISPMFNRIVTSMDVYKEDLFEKNILVKPKGTVRELQKVIAVGSTVRNIRVGDYVHIDFTRYQIISHSDNSLARVVKEDKVSVGYKLNILKLDGVPHLLLYDQDIDYKIGEFEIVKNPILVVPEKPKLYMGE